jgi:peptide-methionine (S)-S-oxide reductase
MKNNNNDNNSSSTTQIATLANGCFWCSEAIFKRLKGIKSVLPGYSGGIVKNPSYEQVSTGRTGHAESIQIEFDPKVIPYEKILDIFWYTHDPTTLNRQGNDIGTQYRSAIFYHDEKQKEIAEKSKNDLERADVYKNPIVTGFAV